MKKMSERCGIFDFAVNPPNYRYYYTFSTRVRISLFQTISFLVSKALIFAIIFHNLFIYLFYWVFLYCLLNNAEIHCQHGLIIFLIVKNYFLPIYFKECVVIPDSKREKAFEISNKRFTYQRINCNFFLPQFFYSFFEVVQPEDLHQLFQTKKKAFERC